jgi:hypothetical protein
MTKETKTAYDALHRIQKTLKAPKGQYNSFGKYHYRSCEDILEGLKAVLEAGETVTITDEIVMVGDRFYIKATASFCFGGQCVSSTGYAREPESRKGMDDSQVTGSTSSYARKYALNALFLIDDTKDADATNDHEKKPATKAEKPEKKVDETPLTPEQKEKVQAIFSAVKDASNEKTLNSIEALHKDFIATLPEDKAEWLRGQIMIKRAHFITLNAG